MYSGLTATRRVLSLATSHSKPQPTVSYAQQIEEILLGGQVGTPLVSCSKVREIDGFFRLSSKEEVQLAHVVDLKEHSICWEKICKPLTNVQKLS